MSVMNMSKKQYISHCYGCFVGKTIKSIQPLTKSECDGMGWEYEFEDLAVVVMFTDGSGFVPMRDEEGNGAGFLAKVI